MAQYRVTFEGELFTSDDDKYVEFKETSSTKTTIPDDFMPKMFEYLESDLSYEILYQIKTISKDGSQIEPKEYVSIVFQYEDGTKGGLLLKDTDGSLGEIGTWKVSDTKKLIDDIYSNPSKFQLVFITLAESLAP